MPHDDDGLSLSSGGSDDRSLSDFGPTDIEDETGESQRGQASMCAKTESKGPTAQSEGSLCLGLPAFELYEPLTPVHGYLLVGIWCTDI